MTPYNGEPNQSFHRDRSHWEKHPLRMDYMQLMVYLTDVNQETHCFALSPKSANAPILDTVGQKRHCRLSWGGWYSSIV